MNSEILANNSIDYLTIEKIYKNIFSQYLIKNTKIIEYDEIIKNSMLDFGVSTKEPKPYKIYNTNYFYMCNKFYTERLSTSDIDILKKYNNQQTIIINDELNDLIKRTIKDIIYVKSHLSSFEGEIKIAYGPAIPKYLVRNDSLAIKIIYDNNINIKDLDSKSKKELKKLVATQREYIENISNYLSDELNGVGIPNKIITIFEQELMVI